MNTQKGFSNLLGLLLFISLVGGGLYFYIEKTSKDILVVGTTSIEIEKEKNDSYVEEKIKSSTNQNITDKSTSNDQKILFENNDYSFTYNSENSCIKVNDEYLNKEGKEGVWLCPGPDISTVISGTPDEAIDRLIFPGGPDSDGIWGKTCFYDEKRITPNGYTVRYFEDPNVSELWGSENCGTHPTKQAAETVGNTNIYFVVSSKNNEFIVIKDINNSTSTTVVWEIIDSFKFK